ncbi:hypothetical protein HF577_16585 [Pseudonocardia xinjiangensis]|uniref:SUKH-4 immunity protein of toxin-antitoxin system n=1 Tax=Pseudonocardia xinjiangensis TaxID=75289 RepID=A0ABX1RE70_9PSEU|nr:hypothetical protein [Pseudonocardia xinjiangensis]
MPRARFLFDPGSGAVLWPTEVQDQEYWGHPACLEVLPISAALRDELTRLIEWYDRSLNWDYPPDPGPWREPECQAFNAAVRRALDQLRAELGDQWAIEDQFREEHEDPDLDRYLANPSAFRR